MDAELRAREQFVAHAARLLLTEIGFDVLERPHEPPARRDVADRAALARQLGDRLHLGGGEARAPRRALRQTLVQQALGLGGHAGHQHARAERAAETERQLDAVEFVRARDDRMPRVVARRQPVGVRRRDRAGELHVLRLELERMRFVDPSPPEPFDASVGIGAVHADAHGHSPGVRLLLELAQDQSSPEPERGEDYRVEQRVVAREDQIGSPAVLDRQERAVRTSCELALRVLEERVRGDRVGAERCHDGSRRGGRGLRARGIAVGVLLVLACVFLEEPRQRWILHLDQHVQPVPEPAHRVDRADDLGVGEVVSRDRNHPVGPACAGGRQRVRSHCVGHESPLVPAQRIVHPASAGVCIDQDHVVLVGELERQA